ncbi:hypothetical protein GXW82_14610 [Streptacidiphilus sp. 4-A2]|nr:hypothetical protein [Streptacidiphilus sp. 4-A2]
MNEPAAASVSCGVVVTIPKGRTFYADCWKRGDDIAGDNVWYYGAYMSGDSAYYGDVSGEYLATGHDPVPGMPEC